MTELLGWPAFALGVAAKLFVAHKKWWCWIAFISANILWTIFGILTGSPSLAVTSIAYTIFDLYGYYKWRHNNV